MANPVIISIPAASSCENVAALREAEEGSERSTSEDSWGQTWTYHILDEETIASRLQAKMNELRSGSSVSFTFQPFSDEANQDRRLMEEWTIAGRTWYFDCILDGHVNHATVDYVATHLPHTIKATVELCCAEGGGTPATISAALEASVSKLDLTLLQHFTAKFPIETEDLSDEEILDRLRTDPEVVSRCFGGCTVLASLSDALNKDLWVINLGDSYSALGENSDGSSWTSQPLNTLHSVDATDLEKERIEAEHPDESPIENDRVLDYLQPTRSMGDLWMKLPAAYTTRVLAKVDQQWISEGGLSRLSAKVLTPPYVSNIPEVAHFKLPSTNCFLLLASDGLDAPDFPALSHEEALLHWVTVVGNSLPETADAPSLLPLLREVIGAEDSARVSRNLTLEMDTKWLDDITVIVRRFV